MVSTFTAMELLLERASDERVTNKRVISSIHRTALPRIQAQESTLAVPLDLPLFRAEASGHSRRDKH